MIRTKIGLGIAVVSAIGIIGYFGAVAYTGRQVDQNLDRLRGSWLEHQTNGMIGISDLKVSSGFFERDGTADVIIAAPMHAPVVLPITFSILQAPSIDSAARVNFVLDVPSASRQMRALSMLGSPHVLQGVFKQGYGGNTHVNVDSYPLQGSFRQAQVKWGGVHLDINSSGDASDIAVQANARVDPLQVTNSADGRMLNAGEMNLTAHLTGGNSRGSIDETFSIGASSAVQNGEKVFVLNAADGHLESEWDLVDPKSPGFRIKEMAVKVDSQKPGGAVAMRADAVIPMSKGELASLQAANYSAALSGIFRQMVVHTSLSVPKALLAQNPLLAGIGAQYGKEEGDTVQIDATAQSGRIIVNGQYVL